MVNNLLPGYKPPNSKAIGGVLLDEVYNELKCGAKDILNGCLVSLCVDGWSNVSSDSVMGMSVQHKDKVFLVRSVDASGNKNTGEFLRDKTKEVIVDVQTEYQCKIVSIVTDNAENMKKMRSLVVSNYPEIIAYGCGAHMLNLLAKDLHPSDVLKKNCSSRETFSKFTFAPFVAVCKTRVYKTFFAKRCSLE